MTANNVKIGIIGGSGLEDAALISSGKQITVKTPYGAHSKPLVSGKYKEVEVVLLSRHGLKHSLSPSSVPYRANIWTLKKLGCTHILATSACGSLHIHMKPGDFVFVDQIIDHTKTRTCSFYSDKPIHTPMAYPFSSVLREQLSFSAKKLGYSFHEKGTMITIEGPRFSTFAESVMFQQWGADVINMSTVPEVFLANELSIPYQVIAMVTDYDCWKKNEESVSADLIYQRMKENKDKVLKLLLNAIQRIKPY